MSKQLLALCYVNLKSLPHRWASSLISLLSIACVSAVILSVMALTEGMTKTMQKSGLEETVLVMRTGAVSELQSVLFPMEVDILANNQAIVRDDNNHPIHSAEMFVNAEYKRSLSSINKNDHKNTVKNELVTHLKSESLSLRGISQDTYFFRPHFKIVQGDLFNPGLREIIIGQAIARRMPELVVGKSITLGSSIWKISGIFSDENSVFESEVWADLKTVQNDYQRGNTIQSVRLAIKDTIDISGLINEWSEDPRLNIKIIKEKQYFASQAENLTRLIRWVGMPVAFIMAIGAIIAALNTMYSAIANRSAEIATHKAIGFSPWSIFFSIISEALLLALVGGVIGVIPLYLIFDGWVASTTGMNNLSQMMFNFDISLLLMTKAIMLSLLIGLFGGALPAIKAMKLPVTLALREV